MRKAFLIIGTLLCAVLLLVAWLFNLWPFAGEVLYNGGFRYEGGAECSGF